MSNTLQTALNQRNRASLLAEAVAAGLHSLAQPLTVAQCRLEIAVMAGDGVGENRCVEALVAVEMAVAKLEFLRDIIRPFRESTEFASESMKRALLSAQDQQQEALIQEGIQVRLRQECAEGIVVAPRAFVSRITFLLFDLLRSLMPNSVSLDIIESELSVTIHVSLSYEKRRVQQIAGNENALAIQCYVEVLAGNFSMAPDGSSIQLSIPKLTNRDPIL
jgi:hypothetical protein